MNNREHAKRIGAKSYANESHCEACFTFQRYTVNRACVECQKAKNRQRLANPETQAAVRESTRLRVAKHYANKRKNKTEFDDIFG